MTVIDFLIFWCGSTFSFFFIYSIFCGHFLSISFFLIRVRQIPRLLRSVVMGAEKLVNGFFEWSGKGLILFGTQFSC
jgi:hypothetical protein